MTNTPDSHGRAGSGKSPVTLQQIAELAGTSKSTVSRVVSNDPRISRATSDRVWAVMKKHGYRPNVFARALAGGKTGQIGVLTSNISSGFFAEVIRGIDLQTAASQNHLLVSIAHGGDDYARLFNELSLNGQVDGLVLVDPPLDLLGRDLESGHIPLVLCACAVPLEAESWRCVDSVTVDNQRAMHEIVEHLVGTGYRRLVHLAGPSSIYDAGQRKLAFLDAVQRHAGIVADVIENHLIRDDGSRTMRERYSDPDTWPDAIVAFNDSVACGVLADMHRVGRFVAVTGWDNGPETEVLGITSVEMPLTGLGEESARCLFDRIHGKVEQKAMGRTTMLENSLHIRSSSLKA